MEKGLYYLAGPHKGTLEQEAQRVEACLKLTAAFLSQGIYVFSPIIYSSKLMEGLHYSSAQERRDILFLYLLDFLRVSKGMILDAMEALEESWGVQEEFKFCRENRIPVYRIDPNQMPENLSQIFSQPLRKSQLNALLEAV